MIYEFIATVTAGFGMAGLALIIRHLSGLLGFMPPKWLIPVCAGVGMLGFQIYQEYHWHTKKIDRLPESAQVVNIVTKKTWYRPWSYLKPQVVRFMAVDTNTGITSEENSDIKDVKIYLYERRISTKIIPQLINCRLPAYGSYKSEGMHPDDINTVTAITSQAQSNVIWQKTEKNDPVIQAVCS